MNCKSYRMGASGLPEGNPATRGISLNPGLSGYSTFNKPVNDTRKQQVENSSIYRVDDADSLDHISEGLDRTDREIGGVGVNKSDGSDPNNPKTRYPYRDDKSNHDASLRFIMEAYRAEIHTPIRIHNIDLDGVVKQAAKMGDILQNLNPKVIARGNSCTAKLTRADIKNLRWLFTVNCGNGPKVVKIKAFRNKSITNITKMDLDITCSCPAWQWWGAEYHAVQEGYIDGKPRGTASTPDIRDPERINRLCKHSLAVVSLIKRWSIPKK